MAKLALLGVLFGAAIAFAAASKARISYGLFEVLPDGGVRYELCGKGFKPDGGTRALDVPCVSCDGWQNWTSCEARWRKENDL